MFDNLRIKLINLLKPSIHKRLIDDGWTPKWIGFYVYHFQTTQTEQICFYPVNGTVRKCGGTGNHCRLAGNMTNERYKKITGLDIELDLYRKK